MTEFTGLDIEMAIEHSYTEARNLIDSVLKHMFRSILTNHRPLLDRVKRQFPHDDIVFPDETVVLRFSEGVKLLRESGWVEEGGEEPGEFDDLSRKGEVRLGELVKEKYRTDYYILGKCYIQYIYVFIKLELIHCYTDKFPLEVRPFYAMADPENPRLSNSFDIFVRGGGDFIWGTEIAFSPRTREEVERR